MKRLLHKYHTLDSDLIEQTVTDWLAGSDQAARPFRVNQELNLDRVLKFASNQGLFSDKDIERWKRVQESSRSQEQDTRISWRDVCKIEPSRRLQLERLAAKIYGFRPVLVCQMSSLVLADLLTAQISPLMWEQMYEMGIAPVVEHGQAPTLNGRIVCVSSDPTDRKTRNYIDGITDFKAELAYADARIVSGVLDMMAQHIEAIGAAVYVVRPDLKKIDSFSAPIKRAA